MEMHQIQYFLQVARTLNVTRAAEELHVSQPSLSRQMKLLEEELDVLLFERLPQGLRLTPAGRALQAHLEAVAAQLEHTPRLMAPFARGLQGRVNIGSVPSLSAHFLPAALAAFLRAYPGVETAVHVLATSADVFHEIKGGSIDIGVCADADPGLAQALLFTEPLVAAVPVAGMALAPSVAAPLAASGALGLAALRELPYVATPAACTIRRQVEQATAGRLNRVLEVDQLASALQFVAQGTGITVTPASLAARNVWPGVRFLPLDPPLSQTVYAFWRPGSFVDDGYPLVQFLREYAGRGTPPSVLA